jgi:hypothetical protein
MAQEGFGNNWVLGQGVWNGVSGSLLSFNNYTINVAPIQMEMELEGSVAVMSDSIGNLLFYSNGCYIANRHHEMMPNSDSIGLGKLETSFCNTGGNPMTQGIMALPAPSGGNFFYLFYTDIEDPYEFPIGLYFPLAPLNLYYCLIDMGEDNGDGAVIEKNQLVVSDTLARGMIQAARHANGKDWWVVMPESHSNCYYTVRLASDGVDTVFLQCSGFVWGDNDPPGQAVFSPDRKKYVRVNNYYGLNIYDFNDSTGEMSNPLHISFGLDTLNRSGAAFSPNSRFLYVPAWDKLYQFDMHAPDIEASRLLIAELSTPTDIPIKTRFNQALLAPDGKIYIGGTANFVYLHTIHNPNCQGLDCNLEQYALETFTNNTYGLPNLPNYVNWNESDTCNYVVNLDENEVEEAFRVYPNPFKDEITMEGKLPCTVIVYDSLGRIALKRDFQALPDSIDLQNLANGVYYYSIWSNNGYINCGKLIKAK